MWPTYCTCVHFAYKHPVCVRQNIFIDSFFFCQSSSCRFICAAIVSMETRLWQNRIWWKPIQSHFFLLHHKYKDIELFWSDEPSQWTDSLNGSILKVIRCRYIQLLIDWLCFTRRIFMPFHWRFTFLLCANDIIK